MTTKKRPAQTMLEMVIAAGVIVVAVVSSTALIISTINIGRTSQNRIEAVNLAREGTEAVRMVRDSNLLKRTENIIDDDLNDATLDSFVRWDDSGKIDDGYDPLNGNYILEFSEPSVVLIETGSEPQPVYYHSDPYYTQADCEGCVMTKFSRLISISECDEPIIEDTITLPCRSVTVTVSWTERSGVKEVTATEKLYEWR